MNIFSLSNKTALVTGGAGYLGSSMCYALARSGATVLINSRNDDKKLNELIKKINLDGYNAKKVVFDIENKDQTTNGLKLIQNKPLDILINNAYSGGAGTIENSNEKKYAQAFKNNIIAVQSLFKICLPSLRIATKKWICFGNQYIFNIWFKKSKN